MNDLTLRLGDNTFPAKYQVCPTCKGRGTSSAYLGAFTTDEMYEMGDDFRDAYLAGDYDRPCSNCSGRTTILVPDMERMTYNQQQEVIRYEQQITDLEAMEAAERRMGC